MGKERYDYVVNLREGERKLFEMVCKNYLRDSIGVNNVKVNTVRYWFLHNIFSMMDKIDCEGIRELVVLRDYLECRNRVLMGEMIYLPGMLRFGVWGCLSNVEKQDLHYRLVVEMMYLDDNYFFMMHYLKNHDRKFLERLYKKPVDEKRNNFVMHLVRSANGKNNGIAYKNFRKIWIYFEKVVYGESMLKYLKEKNGKGMRAIHYVSYMRKDFYFLVVERIVEGVSLNTFMEMIFWQLIRNIRRYWQLEFVMEKILFMDAEKEMGFLEKMIPHRKKFEKLYGRVLGNKSIPFKDRMDMVGNMIDYGLVILEESHRDLMGRRMWEGVSYRMDEKML